MGYTKTKDAFVNVDIYLIDQVLKDRYHFTDSILDAGCGVGRNLKWFYVNDYKISGIDTDKDRIQKLKSIYPKSADNFEIGNLDNLPYNDNQFNHIICSAVLHFARNEEQFLLMFSELIRVLKPKGTLLIRVASNIGLDGNSLYLIERKSNREATFFITRSHIKSIKNNYNIDFIEPVKTTNVEDKRAMTTLVIRKLF